MLVSTTTWPRAIEPVATAETNRVPSHSGVSLRAPFPGCGSGWASARDAAVTHVMPIANATSDRMHVGTRRSRGRGEGAADEVQHPIGRAGRIEQREAGSV